MVGYAEARGCRWQTLLGYFGGERLPGERCGHCDYCKFWASRSGTAAPAPVEIVQTEPTEPASAKRTRRKG
jgi:hypothetical protein